MGMATVMTNQGLLALQKVMVMLALVAAMVEVFSSVVVMEVLAQHA